MLSPSNGLTLVSLLKKMFSDVQYYFEYDQTRILIVVLARSLPIPMHLMSSYLIVRKNWMWNSLHLQLRKILYNHRFEDISENTREIKSLI